jgi:AraC family transcriptional regulator of adaptative response / DNA-3-methyladenine glycosylase II
LARVRHLFDLCCDPDAVFGTLAPMNTISPGLCVCGTRLPGCFDTFEMAVRAVLGQQITVKAARTLAARLAENFGAPVQTGMEELTRVFPSPNDIVALKGPIENHLGPLGITSARAKTILALARAFIQGEMDFGLRAQAQVQAEAEAAVGVGAGAGAEAGMEKLTALPGIGPWTAHYIAMRAAGWPDAFPHTDYGVKKALAPRSPDEILALAETWRPWRSYATVNLWNSL